MKELADILDSFLDHLEGALMDLEELSHGYGDVHERVRGIRVGTRHLASLCGELLDDIQQRVYCIEVESTVTQTIKILAKNEDDAVELANDIGERRLRLTLGKEHDYDVYSHSTSLGDESQLDDEADEEYPYDGK